MYSWNNFAVKNEETRAIDTSNNNNNNKLYYIFLTVPLLNFIKLGQNYATQ